MIDETTYIEFLRESNAIEGVYDDRSLTDAIEAWKFLITKKKVGITTILKTHQILMRNTDLEMHEKGALRQIPVYIGGHEALDPDQVPERLKTWVRDFRVKALHFDAVQDMHVQFERIHPFVDGNGRVGRMLMNWQVCNHLSQPPMIIKEENRFSYYEWFR